MGKAMSGIGTLYMGLLDSDRKLVGGYRRVGNAYPFSVQVSTEEKSQKSRMKENAGQNIFTKVSLSEITGSMTLREWDARNLAWALSGEAAPMSGSGGTVSAETVTLIADEWVKLEHEKVSSVVISGATEGTDYEVNSLLGMVKMLSSGSLSAGDVSVAYSYGAESGYRINIGSKTQVRVAILLDGENEFDGSEFYGVFDSVVLASSAEINFISDPDGEGEELPFSLTFETLDGKTSPGTINGLDI